MYYHASPVGGIKTLEPRISNHGAPLVYFSKKRENTLVYLSNAVEKFCREAGFPHAGSWTTWGPYGFRNGILLLEEYYPNALEETYRGVSGYVYRAASIREADWADSIPDAAVSAVPVPVDGVEFIPDACRAILDAERAGLLTIARYGEHSQEKLAWIEKTIRSEYDGSGGRPEYRHFLRSKFPFLR